jgi:hypothetical protein
VLPGSAKPARRHDWHGLGTGPFASSKEAYEALAIRFSK